LRVGELESLGNAINEIDRQWGHILDGGESPVLMTRRDVLIGSAIQYPGIGTANRGMLPQSFALIVVIDCTVFRRNIA